MNAPANIKPSIVSALAKALPELESAKKNKANPAFKSKYADLAAVIEALEPITKHGLWYRQQIHESAEGVTIETLYIHESGESLSAGTLFMPATKRDAQGYGSALTYARRYSLQTAFGLATEDDDGNAAVKASQDAGGHSKREVSPRQSKHSALKTAIRGFVHELGGCGDGDELSAFLATPEAIKLIAEVREKMPHWWDGTDWPEDEPRPDEFVTLSERISRRSRECAERTAQYLNA